MEVVDPGMIHEIASDRGGIVVPFEEQVQTDHRFPADVAGGAALAVDVGEQIVEHHEPPAATHRAPGDLAVSGVNIQLAAERGEPRWSGQVRVPVFASSILQLCPIPNTPELAYRGGHNCKIGEAGGA